MMTFIKNHLISLASGLAALIFIAIGVLGMMQDGVVTEMQQRVSRAGQIGMLRSSAKNDACIAAEAERGQLFEREYTATVAEAERINARKPLMDNVFPKIEREAVAFEYRDAYARAMEELPLALKGGGLPDEREIADAQFDIDELAAQIAEEMDEGGPSAPPIAAVPTPVAVAPAAVVASPVTVAGAGGGRGRTGTMSVGGAGTAYGGAGAGTGDPQKDAVARANITKARSIRCYVSTDPASSSLHLSPILDRSARPAPDQMWYAQVAYWVQQDVINAIASLNEEAASELEEGDGYVANMPVKRVQSIRVLGYVTGDKNVRFSAYTPGGLGGLDVGAAKKSFTGRKSDEKFDVVQFVVVVVADQRELPKLIDRITTQNFYQLIEMNYSAVTAGDEDTQQGYLYGAEPVVRVTLVFEGYMARSVYEAMFPAEVREALGINSGN